MQKHIFWIMIGSIITLFVGIGLLIINLNNQLVTGKQQVVAQWSQVENQMQRRFDLTPQLVGSVKGQMKHEEKIFTAIANARKSFQNADSAKHRMAANGELDRSTNLLINAIHENYPQLQSNQQVQQLMTEVAGSENRLSQERRTYNQNVQAFNLQVQRFPASLIAQNLGFRPFDYFKADVHAAKAPKIKLN